MMFLWLFFGVVVVAQAHIVKKVGDVNEELEWPRQYTLKAQRMSLTDDVVETYEVWRTSRRSRIDYNDGYVKSLVKLNKSPHRGIKYSIYPVATRTQDEETACVRSYGNIGLETILPEELYGYEIVGNETINDIETTKFTLNMLAENTESRTSIWASYDTKARGWVPVRYEVLEFNVWLGSKGKHEMWNFYDFSTAFSYRNVFNTDSYDCSDENSTDTSEALTKNLLLANPDKEDHVDQLFEMFKNNFAKNYADMDEHLKRRSIFKTNMRHVILHNRRNLGYKLALNHLADKTSEEMTRYLGLWRRPEGKVGNVPFPYDEKMITTMVDNLPKEYDTRLLGLVSNVKNQEDCGSCWTFGTTAAVEGALARINGGKLLALSNQALIDCAWAFGAAGCDGGTDNAAYEWMMNYGLPTEAEYGTYMNRDGLCKIKNMTKLYPIRGYTDVTPLSVGALKIALVNHGPLSVSVHASKSFQLYSSGIFYDPSCDQQMLDHEVTLVGYGEQDGDTFWILKNSWGPNWGLGGFMYISTRDNNCGIATEPTYVVF